MQLIEELGLQVLGDDYDKCFSGRCLTCNAPNHVNNGGPQINVSYVSGAAVNVGNEDAEKAKETALDSDKSKLGCQREVGVVSSRNGGIDLQSLTLGDRNEEGSHFDGSVSPCHQSDDEWEEPEPHGELESLSEATSLSSEQELLGKNFLTVPGKCGGSTASEDDNDSEQHEVTGLKDFEDLENTKSRGMRSNSADIYPSTEISQFWVE